MVSKVFDSLYLVRISCQSQPVKKAHPVTFFSIDVGVTKVKPISDLFSNVCHCRVIVKPEVPLIDAAVWVEEVINPAPWCEDVEVHDDHFGSLEDVLDAVCSLVVCQLHNAFDGVHVHQLSNCIASD